MRNCFAIA